jgi:hypothetical protein
MVKKMQSRANLSILSVVVVVGVLVEIVVVVGLIGLRLQSLPNGNLVGVFSTNLLFLFLHLL